MNKNLILAIGLVAVGVIGISIYGSMKVIDPMTEEASMTKEMTTEMMSEEMTDESMAAGEGVATTEMMTESSAMMKNEGDAAPAFDLMDVSGNSVSLESLKGERVYIKFWARSEERRVGEVC